MATPSRSLASLVTHTPVHFYLDLEITGKGMDDEEKQITVRQSWTLVSLVFFWSLSPSLPVCFM